MFEALSGKLTGVFDKLRQRGALNETDVMEALREVRLALLDADVALDVVKDFIAKGAYEASPTTPAELMTEMHVAYDKWGQMVKSIGFEKQ